MIAAVLGGATGGMDELARVKHDAVFAVNDAAADYPGQLAAFVTLHPEHLPRWLQKRRAAGLPEPGEIVTCSEHPLATRVADYRWPGMNASGSSGLFAVKIALEKYEPVILCGVPMEAKRAHFFDTAAWVEVESFRDAWYLALPHLRGRVTSMSGWTAELLGKPQ